MQHMNNNIPPSPKKRVMPMRVSVPVTPELLATFERMGKATNQGTGAAIAEWLTDTHEASELMAGLLERARESPKVVMREMHAYALGLSDQTGDLLRKMTFKKNADGSARAGHGGALHGAGDAGGIPPVPPSCNTGGKFPKRGTMPKGGKST